MNNPRLATRYAKSLLDVATELNQVDVIYGDMKLLQGICKTNKDFVTLLKSPVVKPNVKVKIIEAVLTGKINITSLSFINLLIKKGRELNLPEIVSAFIDQYNSLRGIHKVKLLTAQPVSDEIKNSIIEKVKNAAGITNIELEAVVNEDLIGGFVLEAGDQLVDASVSRHLRDIKKQFMDNQYIHKIR